MIPNPDYVYDEKMHSVCTDGCTHIGFELWQVQTGTLFDNIIVTNSLEEAQKFAKETFFKKKDDEADMLDEKKEAEREEQRKAAVSTVAYTQHAYVFMMHFFLVCGLLFVQVTAVSYLVLLPFFNIHTGC